MASRIQIRRDTAANFASANPILAQGEFAIEIDNLNNGGTVQIKIGDGVTDYNTLPYEFAGVTDHGALTGLGDDDHLQYLTEGRHDSLPFDNPHNVNKAQVGLGNVPDVDATQRSNHIGSQPSSTISDFGTAVQTAETTTSLSLNANILTYVDEDGNSTNIDLSFYLDDTNLARIVSGTLDPVTGIVTFFRDDGTSFTVDFSPLLGDVFSVYEVFQIGVTTLASNVYTLVTMTNEESIQTGYSLSGGRVTVALSGRYKLTYSISGDGLDFDRSVIQGAIFINGTELIRSKAFGYCRNFNTGEGTANKTVTVSLNAGDIVDARALLIGDGVETISQASNLIVEKIG